MGGGERHPMAQPGHHLDRRGFVRCAKDRGQGASRLAGRSMSGAQIRTTGIYRYRGNGCATADILF